MSGGLLLPRLRSALFVLYLAITVIPWAVLSLIASIFIRGSKLYWLTTFWLRIAITGAKLICGVNYRILGMDNLNKADRSGPIILLPKHQSTWETFAFPTLMPHPLCYVFKRELLWIPFFGWAMARLDMVHIDRSRRSVAWNKVAEQGRLHMSNGNWVIMFPEGTRIPRGQRGVYKGGGARLALATGASVLPIAVSSAKCWPPRSFVLRPGTIDVSIGPMMASTGRQPDELMRDVETWIETEMRRIDPQAYTEGAPTPLAKTRH